ncbi:hypothetical protein BGZ80_002600 [Entomortierella chlamydospora]|uniref:Uncharacterized protein n=1 Tax=Entomortierella chlamydospora TaxID=101097 RepID=A0A9P6SX10_9FUNG|nr:hypothetical protein BGZ80_002600 [Entomortierella chlamydospora]
MVNVVDFFPINAKRHFSHQDRALLDLKDMSSALVMDLPLRYIFQYALNHLQEEEGTQEDEMSPILGPSSRRSQRTVLIVTDSKIKLQEWMRLEQQLYEMPEFEQAQQQIRDGPNVQDEFISATQTQTQSQVQLSQLQIEQRSQQLPIPQNHVTEAAAHDIDAPRVTNNEKEKDEKFQAELWAKIQIRYAPTVYHVQSLFRCLHLDSETTQGRTFGHGRGGHSPTVDDYGVVEDDSHLIPTLVLLIGCFHGHENSTNATQSSSSSSLCMLSSHLANLRSATEVPSLDPTANFVPLSTQQSQLQSQQQQQQQSQISYQLHQTSLQPASSRLDSLDRERVQYIKTVSQAISEIKDSLEWIERVSGQNVGLLVFENTVDPKALADLSHSNLLQSKLPSPRELWLQKVVGFWLDVVVVVEPQHLTQCDSPSIADPNQPYSQEMLEGETPARTDFSKAQSSKDSLSLWLKTQQSIRTMLFRAAPSFDEKSAASAGAVVGLRWKFDAMENCFQFQILS